MSNQARMRVCLKCQRKFFSTGPGNRICKKCNRENMARYGHMTEWQLAVQRGRKYWNGEPMDESFWCLAFDLDDDWRGTGG